jgi:S-DNA-T family DNA segregation ATPase FtsK/SpoIIIE
MEPGKAGYVLPPLELLNDPESQDGEDEKALLQRAELLTHKFREFAVDGSVVAIHPGPVVTTFEFKPDAGIKYSKITALTDDLCLALRAESVRIDRIPGKSTVGIEVPNRLQEVIYPKELIGSDRFRATASKLTLALGKDIGGNVFVSELDKMPHLLIAGATGAGKSVGLNGMIASILYKATPEQVRFIMIDTKMIELGIYADIPHLLVPVVTDPKTASTALKWAVREMEIRYRKLASVGVRNIAQFNSLLEKEPDHTMVDERTGEERPLGPLPYIVIVIDEMADLMMVSSADVEESVMRLAQMARAVGLHLILATQRPSVDVITGTIKANFPCRIAYRVSQRVDSRTIVDQQGAEHLLGKGDMLFLPPGSARLLRLHGGFITEPELNRITTFLKRSAKPVYDESVLREPEEERPEYEESARDDRFYQAVELVLQEGQCSITLIQRRMRLGYARAARIVDSMEQAGIVGPADGSKPREVLVGPEILEALRTDM